MTHPLQEPAATGRVAADPAVTGAVPPAVARWLQLDLPDWQVRAAKGEQTNERHSLLDSAQGQVRRCGNAPETKPACETHAQHA